MKAISVIPVTLIGNRGSEAMLTSTIGRIREIYPNMKFNVYSYYPKLDRQLINSEGIKIYSATPLYLVFVLFPMSLFYKIAVIWVRINFLDRLFPKSISDLAKSEILIDLAGISFVDSRKKFLLYNTLSLLPAFILNVPVVKFAQAMGPFSSLINKTAARIILSNCLKVYARGKSSAQHLDSLGLTNGLVSLASDVAFMHKHSYALTTENEEYFKNEISKIRLRSNNAKGLIGICPNMVIYQKMQQKYLYKLVEIIKNLSYRGFDIVLFPNATLPSHNYFNNDLIIIDKLKTLLDRPNIYFVDHCVNTSQIKQVIKLCDITVVSRFHAMIASLSLGVPTLVIGWGHKYKEIMEEFGLAKYVIDYRQANLKRIGEAVDDLLSSKTAINKKIAKNLEVAKAQAAIQIDYVIKIFA